MLRKLSIILALALAAVQPVGALAKGGAVTFKECSSEACKRHAFLSFGATPTMDFSAYYDTVARPVRTDKRANPTR